MKETVIKTKKHISHNSRSENIYTDLPGDFDEKENGGWDGANFNHFIANYPINPEHTESCNANNNSQTNIVQNKEIIFNVNKLLKLSTDKEDEAVSQEMPTLILVTVLKIKTAYIFKAKFQQYLDDLTFDIDN